MALRCPRSLTTFHGEWAEDVTMIVRVENPPNGKTWIYNGYAARRVYVGNETELPDFLEKYDDEGKYLGKKECRVPSWGVKVRESANAPLVMMSGRAPIKALPPEETLAGEKARVKTRGGLKRPSDIPIGE